MALHVSTVNGSSLQSRKTSTVGIIFQLQVWRPSWVRFAHKSTDIFLLHRLRPLWSEVLSFRVHPSSFRVWKFYQHLLRRIQQLGVLFDLADSDFLKTKTRASCSCKTMKFLELMTDLYRWYKPGRRQMTHIRRKDPLEKIEYFLLVALVFKCDFQ